MVVAGIVLGWDGGLSTQALGLLGALTAGLLVYVLAWKRGTTGYRIVLVGIGIAWICTSITDYLLARGQRFQAQAALGWLVGNLNGRTWEQIGPLAITMAVLVPPAILLGRQIRVLQLGDDVAKGLGTRVHIVRVAVLLISVGLVAFGTATAGPVAFVALAAPQVAQRLAGDPVPATRRGGAHRCRDGARVRPRRPEGHSRHRTAGRDRHRGARRTRTAVAAHPRQPRRFRRLKTCHRSSNR